MRVTAKGIGMYYRAMIVCALTPRAGESPDR